MIDARTRILILGSLPGVASLRATRYYAHPRNQFWRLLGEVLGQNLAALDYEARLAALLDRGVGLWDVVAEAEREGSLDAAIRNVAANDLPTLVAALPALRTIGFNGATAARIGMARLAQSGSDARLVPLPSSSPAYTLPFEAKLAAWRSLLHG